MERNALVLDASIIIKWFTQEEKRKEAVELRDKYSIGEIEIIVPDIILYEVSNALRYNPNFKEEDVKAAVQSLYDLDLNIINPTEDILERAIEIAYLKDTSLYDAFYIALSEIIGFDYLTADEKLYNKVKEDLNFVHIL